MRSYGLRTCICSLQVYFEEQQLAELASWVNLQSQDNMSRICRMIESIYRSKGSVLIREMKRDAWDWNNTLHALNELINHEKYMAEQIEILSVLTENVHVAFQRFLSVKYICRRAFFTSRIFIELLHIFTQEKRWRLPLNIDLNNRENEGLVEREWEICKRAYLPLIMTYTC